MNKNFQSHKGWGHTVPQENPKEFADTFLQVMNEILY